MVDASSTADFERERAFNVSVIYSFNPHILSLDVKRPQCIVVPGSCELEVGLRYSRLRYCSAKFKRTSDKNPLGEKKVLEPNSALAGVHFPAQAKADISPMTFCSLGIPEGARDPSALQYIIRVCGILEWAILRLTMTL